MVDMGGEIWYNNTRIRKGVAAMNMCKQYHSRALPCTRHHRVQKKASIAGA